MKHHPYIPGLVSVSFRKSTPEEILQAAAAAGLSCIEWGSDVHVPCHDREALANVVALQAAYGIGCSSYGTYFRIGETPMTELVHYVHAAKALGTNLLRLWCGAKSGKEMTAAEREALLAACREATAIATAHGVTLCMECHRKTFTENPDDAVWLMQAVNSPHFRMYWQPFQWQTAAENLENAKKIAPYATHIHVFNWRGDRKLPLCEAISEWQQYLSHFPAPRTLLLEFMPNGTIEELSAEAEALKTILGGMQ